jgi:tetratricopeptide (TPR) repeat protein
VHLKPPPLAPVSFDDACALWDRAEISACLQALRLDSSPEAAILAARCLVRLNRPTDALERLLAASAEALGTSDLLRGKYTIATALTHFHLGNDDLVDSTLCDSRAYIYSARDRNLEAELEVLESQIAWSRHDLPRARTLAEHTALSAPTATLRARALETLGAIAGAEGKYKIQVDFYERAWAQLDQGVVGEPWVRAIFLQVLSALCNDLFRRDLVARLSERERALHWTRDTEGMRFEVLQHLARCHALSGDHVSSFKLLRQAAEIAPSLPWRIMIFAERSSLAAEMNERLFAREELDQARSFAESYDWSQARGEERLALLRLAEVAASVDPSGAHRLLEMYRHRLPPVAPDTLAANDDRLRALEAHTFGIVALHCGDTARAIERLTHAFCVWRRIDYIWRALDAAIHLSRLTGDGVFVAYAGRHAKTFPGTWLAGQAARLHAGCDSATST